MNHADHVELIQEGVTGAGSVWADFGSGTGAFTLALAGLLTSPSEIFSVDKSHNALRVQERVMRARFPEQKVHYMIADFTQPLDLPTLDGVMMANALHFQRQKDIVLRLIVNYLRPGGRLILVEYNIDRGNPWVPFPLTYRTWEALAHRNDFANTMLLSTRPSRSFKEIFSAVSTKELKGSSSG